MLPDQDIERLLHIRDAARNIGQFVNGVSEQQFMESDLIQHAVINCLFIIGEVATRITDATRDTYHEIEWDDIRGMRNRLAHAYFDINLGIVWYSATVDTPRLLTTVEQIIDSNR
ncbi:MAG TPA: HepT-like ribonuclease domain-containing protein [Capsulimonadaceae bacterium]|jgi:uncharacterized protein with HEPN domain